MFDFEVLLNIFLLFCLSIIPLMVIFSNKMRDIAIFFSVYSLFISGYFLNSDALDVAFTEAAVGSCVSVIFFLLTIRAVEKMGVCPDEKKNHKKSILVFFIFFLIGLVIFLFLKNYSFVLADFYSENSTNQYYFTHFLEEIEIDNMVTSILASYRAFDTLFELVVVFCAGLGMLLLLEGNSTGNLGLDLKQKPFLFLLGNIFIPFVLVFAFYTQFHGEDNPGGGFQAGVIFSSAVFLYGLLNGFSAINNIFSPRMRGYLMVTGLFIYLIVGVIGLFSSGYFLSFQKMGFSSIINQHIGIFFVELGVAITVTGTLITFITCLISSNFVRK